MTAFLIIALCLAGAAPRAAAADAPALQELIDRARAAPAEFAADALLRLAQSPQLDSERRRVLIEEAFRRAAGARHPLKMRLAMPQFRTGPAAFMDKVYAQNMDVMSLQCRAVRAMLPLDANKAREMFRAVPRPKLERVVCDDALVPDVAAFYQTVAEIAAKAFTPTEVKEGEAFQFVSSFAQSLQSPVEVGPLSRLLVDVPLEPQQFGGLVASFSGALRDLAGDDRSFSATISRAGNIGESIAALMARSAGLDVSAVPLAEAYRAYLVRHLGGERCADSVDREPMSFGVAPAPDAQLAQDPVRYFNEKLLPEGVKPIAGEEVLPSKTEGAAGGMRACESQECKHVAQLYTALLFAPNGLPYGPEKRNTTEWQSKLKEYLAALAAWKDDPSATAGEHFQQKCLFYSNLFNVVPLGPDRETVLRSYLEYLQRNAFGRENRIEWFLPVNGLIALVSLDRSSLRNFYLDLRNSPDPIISLYAEVEEIAPRQPGERLSVM
jgi:hypothetical protein